MRRVRRRYRRLLKKLAKPNLSPVQRELIKLELTHIDGIQR